MKSYYVYCHVDRVNFVPFYIGVGTNDKYKYYTRSRAKKRRSKKWQEYVANINYSYEVCILLESDDYEFISNKEIEFISLHGRIDKGTGTLVNLNDGGRGSKDMSEESFNNMLKKQKCKSVVAYDLTGNRIGVYDRKRSAAIALNIPYGSVDQSLKVKERQAFGYRFYYEKEAPETLKPVKLWTINRKTKLICKNILNNEIFIFNSMKEASLILKIPVGTIGNNLKGTTNLAKKRYKFRYEFTKDFIEKPKKRINYNNTNGITIYMYNLNGDYSRSFSSASEASRYLNIPISTIYSCLTKIQYQTRGYQFSYKYADKLSKVIYKIGKDKKLLFRNIITNEELLFNSIIEASKQLSVSIRSIRHFLYRGCKTIKRKYTCEYVN